MVLRSLSSLSENRLSWSAEVPLKKPEKGKQMENVSTTEGYHDCTPGLTSVCHRLQKDRSFSMMLTELNKDRENLVVLTFNSFKLQFNDAVYIMVTLSLPSLRLLSMPYRYRELCMADGQCDLYLVE